jgi:hypothetical protein
MNLKFYEDIYQTFDIMKNGLYYLGILTGIHTATFVVYLAYKYFNDDTDKDNDKDNDKNENKDSEKSEPELPPQLPQVNKEPVIQMEELTDLLKEKKTYKSLLEQKREELDTLVYQLDKVYDSIGNIRERLDDLNNKPTA